MVPRDHSVYGWACGVPACERPLAPHRDYCHTHDLQWLAQRKQGMPVTEFQRTAEPLKPKAWFTPPPCLICPDVPAWTLDGLCYMHSHRWDHYRGYYRRLHGREVDFDTWLRDQTPFPDFGQCLVEPCPELADNPLRLCRRHSTRYQKAGRPGGAASPSNWSRWLDRGESIPVEYADKAGFDRWCRETGLANRMNGKVSLLGLGPLVKAEIQWAMFHHGSGPEEASQWPLAWLQYVADDCRIQRVNSLVDLDLSTCRAHAATIASLMLKYLRLVYFTREDTKDAGFIETDHFGVRFPGTRSHFDLTLISQRWLRDLVWDAIAARLTADPPRSRTTFETHRRGCVELSAFLEAQAPGGGHDPTALAAAHMTDFIADQRYRAQHGLKSLGAHTQGRGPDGGPTLVTKSTMAATFNGARRILRFAMESGEAEQIGLARSFIVTLPTGRYKSGRRRPFPDDAARALTDELNLGNLEGIDPSDRGLRDAWEALVLTGRRCNEVLKLRLECIGRLNSLPMFWHDQTKVGNYDQAIRIPERLYQRIQQRQDKTVTRFIQRFGRPPTPQERLKIALFPRKQKNRRMLESVSYGWFSDGFRAWVDTLDIAHVVAHQARHTLATNLLKNGADLSHVKRYLGQFSERMAEHYVHLANTDPRLEEALNSLWVAGPGSAEPGLMLSGSEPMTRQEAEALAIDLTHRSTPAEGGFCTFQPVVNGDACPFNLNCHSCDKFVMSGADLVYWHRKREQWRMLAERAPDSTTADYLHEVFEPTARAIDGLEKALAAVGLLDDALALDLRRPQDYFGKVWSTAFRAQDLAHAQQGGDAA